MNRLTMDGSAINGMVDGWTMNGMMDAWTIDDWMIDEMMKLE